MSLSLMDKNLIFYRDLMGAKKTGLVYRMSSCLVIARPVVTIRGA